MASVSHPDIDMRAEGPRDGVFKLTLAGRLDSNTTGGIWRQATTRVSGAKAANVIVDASGIDYCDGAGIALLVHLRRLQSKAGGSLQIDGLRAEFADLLGDQSAGISVERAGEDVRGGLAEEMGEATVEVWRDIQTLISFVGELGVGLAYAVIHPRRVRWRDALRVAEAAGVNAL